MIAFIETVCFVPEGQPRRPAAPPAAAWQRDILRAIYDNPAGTRRAIIPASEGRTPKQRFGAACLLLAHPVRPAGQEPDRIRTRYSAAQSRDQAATIIFSLASKMVRLRSSILVHRAAPCASWKPREDARLPTRSLGRAIGLCRPRGDDGLSVCRRASIIHDELGRVRGPRSQLYEAL